jgi:death on curing protein
MIDYLDLDDVIAAARSFLGKDPEVRDWGLLESALARPQATVFGADAYPGIHQKAAALLHSLARNHALVDGNKRLAWVATRLFYVLNGGDLRAPTVDEGEQFVLAVAAGQSEVLEIAETLALWSDIAG